MAAQRRAFLFGGDSPWRATSFTASDDRVRGGSSISHLTIPALPPNRALFHGTLDTKTLGGAGFASQRSTDCAYPKAGSELGTNAGDAWDLRGWDGLEVRGEGGGGKRFLLGIKDEVPVGREDGREGSGVTWEGEFVMDGETEGEQMVVLPWERFKPTFRGRELERGKVKALDLGNVKRVAVMMRSFFGEQEGEFALWLGSIAVVKLGKDEVDIEEKERDGVRGHHRM